MDSSYILLGVHTHIFNTPHIQRYYTSLSFLIYLINYSNIPQYEYYGKKFIETLNFFNISLLRTEMQYVRK
jgi:hypothetical protein